MSEFSNTNNHNTDPDDPELQDKAAGLMAGVAALFEERQVQHQELRDGGSYQEIVLDDDDDLPKVKRILAENGFTEPQKVSIYFDSEYAYAYRSFGEEKVQPGSENLVVSLKYGPYDIDFWVAHLGDQAPGGLAMEKSCPVHISPEEGQQLGQEIPDVTDPVPSGDELDMLIAMVDELKATS